MNKENKQTKAISKRKKTIQRIQNQMKCMSKKKENQLITKVTLTSKMTANSKAVRVYVE